MELLKPSGATHLQSKEVTGPKGPTVMFSKTELFGHAMTVASLSFSSTFLRGRGFLFNVFYVMFI